MPRTTLLHEGVEVEGIQCSLDLVHITGYREPQWLTILSGPDGHVTLEIADSEEQGISHHLAYANGAEIDGNGLAVQPLGGK